MTGVKAGDRVGTGRKSPPVPHVPQGKWWFLGNEQRGKSEGKDITNDAVLANLGRDGG